MKTIQKLLKRKRRDLKSKSFAAFSLPELLVVLVIIGILVLIALPNLMPLISKAKSTEAQQQLVFLHTLQKSHFYTNSRYSTSLSDLDFEQAKLVTDGGNANYKIERKDFGRGPLPSLILMVTGSITCGKLTKTRS